MCDDDTPIRDLDMSGMSCHSVVRAIDGVLRFATFIDGMECEVTWDLSTLSMRQRAELISAVADTLGR